MTRRRRAIAALVLAASFAGCARPYVEGRVTDASGEALPGVTVRVAGREAEQDLSDGLGGFRAYIGASTTLLEFSKSGYTSAVWAISPGERRTSHLPDIPLWRLPMNPGVYVVDQYRYAETSFVVPRQFFLKDHTAAFGAELPEDIQDAPGEIFVVAYRTPRYNARLSRLVESQALPGGESQALPVWVAAGTMAAALNPLDAPPAGQAPQLLRAHVGRPLEPGIYGVHWGALEGYTTLDSRVFLFRVPEPPAPPEGGDTENASADGAATKAASEGAAPDAPKTGSKPGMPAESKPAPAPAAAPSKP